MPIRNRNGKLEWRFKVNGHEYSHITDLVDTSRNRTAAMRLEAEARRLVMEGRGGELNLQVQPFSEGADTFVSWAQGEYSEHPNSWKRIRGSMTAAKAFFGKRPISSITHGDLEDFKSWRRKMDIEPVTLRHDLHNLSLLFQYSQKHNWCRSNPVSEVEIPSDREAVRINVLSSGEEIKLFAALDALAQSRSKRTRQGCADLRDLCTLMLNQGCRPEELRALQQSHVDLEHGTFTIVEGKSQAARRTLPMTAVSRSVFAMRLQMPNTWVFPSHKRGQHIGQHQRLWDAVVKRAGLHCVPYDLRHTFATRAVERGVDLPRLAAILGHANLRSIMKYVHLKAEHIAEGMRRFEAGILPAACPLDAVENGEETVKSVKVNNYGKLQ